MFKYITIPSNWDGDTEVFYGLPLYHSICRTPLRHSEDTILAAYRPDSFYKSVHDTLEEANTHLLECYGSCNYSVPIFEVELQEDAALLPSVNGWNELNPYKLVSPDHIVRVVSAVHAGIRYDLSTVWNQCQQFRDKIRNLHPRLDLQLDLSNQEMKLVALLNQMRSLEGKQSYTELLTILDATQSLLDHPSEENRKRYQTLAEMQQGSPSPALQALGICMLALAIVIGTSSVSLGIGLALAGVGVFAIGRRETGVCKAMSDFSCTLP